MWISLSAQPREKLSSRADWGVNIRVRVVQAPVCTPVLSVGEYTTMGGVAVMYGDKEENRGMDPEGDQQFTLPRLHSCVHRNYAYNVYMKPKGNETDAMPLSQSSGTPDRVRTRKVK